MNLGLNRSRITVEEMVRLYVEDHKSTLDIAGIAGISPAGVLQQLRRANVEIRERRRTSGSRATSFYMSPDMERMLGDLHAWRGKKNRTELLEDIIREVHTKELLSKGKSRKVLGSDDEET